MGKKYGSSNEIVDRLRLIDDHKKVGNHFKNYEPGDRILSDRN